MRTLVIAVAALVGFAGMAAAAPGKPASDPTANKPLAAVADFALLKGAIAHINEQYAAMFNLGDKDVAIRRVSIQNNVKGGDNTVHVLEVTTGNQPEYLIIAHIQPDSSGDFWLTTRAGELLVAVEAGLRGGRKVEPTAAQRADFEAQKKYFLELAR